MRLLVQVIRGFEKMRVREIGIPLYILSLHYVIYYVNKINRYEQDYGRLKEKSYSKQERKEMDEPE